MLLHRKPNSPPMVYLDQNKWIDLARAYHGLPQGARFTPVLHKIQAAVQQNAARFPFSSIHVIETLKMGDADRRARLAQVMAEVSEGWTIAQPERVFADELKVAVPKAMHAAPLLLSPTVFGRGIEFAFGDTPHAQTHLRLLDSPVAQEKLLALAALAAVLTNTESLRRPGIDRYNAAMNSIAAEVEQIRNLVRQRPRDLQQRQFIARLIIDRLSHHQDELLAALAPTRIGVETFFTSLGRPGFTQFLSDMPTTHVEMELRNQRFAQYQRPIDSHDLHDISFLSVAIPYCDIVVTERQWVALAQNRQLDQIYHTTLLHDLADLEKHLVVPAPPTSAAS